MIDLSNKKVLVTGATGGIGQALVKKFVSLNAKVLASGTKNEKLDLLKKQYPNINIIIPALARQYYSLRSTRS